MAQKISGLTALSTTYADTDLLEVSVDTGGGTFVSRKMTFLQLRTAFTKLQANLDVNSFQITSASNGNIIIRPNGSGAVLVGGNSTQATELRFMEDSDNGTNYVALKVADALAASTTYTLPTADGTTGQVLSTNGSGTLSWATAAGSSTGRFGIADSSGTYTYYTTLTLAMAAATSGQTIEMFTDYTETGNVTITLKDGVTLNGNGHTYTHSHSAGNSNTFQNTSGVINFTFANLTVIRSGRTLGTSGDHVLATSVNDSQFFFSGVFMESTYGNAVSLGGTTWLYKPHSGNLYARAYLTAISTQGSIDGFTGQSTSSGHGIYMTGGVANKCTGISISGKGIGGTGTNCQGYSTSSIALEGTFSNSYGNSITDRAADGTAYYNCVLISTSGNGASNGIYRNCTIISSSGWGAYHYLNNFDNCHIRSSTNIASGGGFRASFRGCTFLSEWNNAGGHGLDLGADSIVSNCNITVSNTGANCLYKASAVTMKYASNVFAGATTAVNANITQGISNSEDSQGNILI